MKEAVKCLHNWLSVFHWWRINSALIVFHFNSLIKYQQQDEIINMASCVLLSKISEVRLRTFDLCVTELNMHDNQHAPGGCNYEFSNASASHSTALPPLLLHPAIDSIGSWWEIAIALFLPLLWAVLAIILVWSHWNTACSQNKNLHLHSCQGELYEKKNTY